MSVETMLPSWLLSSSSLFAFAVGGCIMVLMYVTYALRQGPQHHHQQQHKHAQHPNKSSAKSSNRQEKAASNAQLQSKLKKKGGAENRWNSRGDKQTYTHPWLLTSLKGHSGQVLDMDFSHNGKYLASCADACESMAAEEDVARLLRPYMLSPEQMVALGYPVASAEHPGCAFILRSDFGRRWEKADASEDSGRGSSEEEPPDPNVVPECVEATCERCNRRFGVASSDGRHVRRERCFYHWGKLRGGVRECCGQTGNEGDACTTARTHVWSGLVTGANGPLAGYAHLGRRRRRSGAGRKRRHPVLAIDCETVYTLSGCEAARVTAVAWDGSVVLDSTVRPSAPLLDCNTRWSGVRAADLAGAPTLEEVRARLGSLAGARTLLVGHALDNDLRALRLLHGRVVDTAALFPHARGLPYRRPLKALAASFLQRTIQSADASHDSVEDARAAMDLALWRLRHDATAPLAT